MAEGEEEVNYASVVFKAGNNPPPAAKRGEETVYGEVKVQNGTKNEDSAGRRRFQHLACCLGILCVILLGGIIGVCVYLTLIHESDPNQFKENSTLLAINTNLSLENANLKRDIQNLTHQLGNMTQVYTVSESNNKNLSAGVQELKTQKEELTTKNQELETEKKNLTQQIQNLTTNWNELNVSRAQWSIDSYCLGYDEDKCKACQRGWNLTQPNCYAYNNPPPPNQKTWEEAQEDCSGKNSDLAVARNSEEKNVIIDKYSPGSSGTTGFWIGLRVEDGEWKWVDGSDWTDSSFNAEAADGHCAVSVKGRGSWCSVSCGEKRRWICQKKALSV